MHYRIEILKRRRRRVSSGSSIPVEAANGNVVQAWKGAVEPQFYGGSGGNEVQLWKGAVEPGL